VDVGILVRPVTADSARVALAYRRPVPHARVREAIRRLTAATGWVSDTPLIVDDRINRDPKTTTALFTLRNAPQISAGAPALQPYLTAFQGWNRVEVIFAQLRPEPTRAAVQFESAALSVRLAQRGPGLSRYIADIRDHAGALPLVAFGQETAPAPQAARAEVPQPEAKQPAGTLFNLPLLLTILGAALIGGTLAYLAVIRRLPARSSARVLRP
jgi:hypothetical protein